MLHYRFLDNATFEYSHRHHTYQLSRCCLLHLPVLQQFYISIFKHRHYYNGFKSQFQWLRMQHYQTHYHCYLRPLRTVFSEFLSCFASGKKCSVFNAIRFIATILCIALSNGSFEGRFNLAGIVFHGNLKNGRFILLNWIMLCLITQNDCNTFMQNI